MSTNAPASGWDIVRRTDRAIVVADMAGSVALYERDEAGTVARWAALLRRLEGAVLPGSGGRLVKSTGDGFILEFAEVSAAMRCASALHREFAAASAGAPPGMEMAARIGVNLADVYANEADIYGRGVNLAARLGSLAQPGGTIVSAAIRDRLVPGLDCEVEDIGPSYFKHATEPVPAFRVIGDGEPEPQPSSHAIESRLVPSIAIIPFVGRLVQAPHDIVGELLADTLIARISRTSSLRVISRLSTSKLQGRSLEPGRIHDILHADFALSGSFSVIGERVVLIAEFARASTGDVLWTRDYRFDLSDILAEDSQGLAAISVDMMDEIAAQEIRRARFTPLPSLEAFSLQIAATSMMHRSSEQDFTRSREALEHLVERHARAATPRAWLATWYVLNATRGRTRDRLADSRVALDHARRALDADPSSSLAMAAEGFIHLHLLDDLGTASSILDRAVAANRSDPLALIFNSIALGFSDFGAEALEASEQALSLSPIDPLRYYYESLGASSAYCAGDFGRAIELCESSLRRNRLHLSTHRTLIASHVAKGNTEEARQAARALLRLSPGFTVDNYRKGFASARSSIGPKVADAMLLAGIPAH